MMVQAFLLCYIVISSGFVRRWIVAPTCSTCLVLICERETAIILLFGSVVYAAFYAISCPIRRPLRPLLALPRPLFLPRAIGSIFAAFTDGKLLDADFRRGAKS